MVITRRVITLIFYPHPYFQYWYCTILHNFSIVYLAEFTELSPMNNVKASWCKLYMPAHLGHIISTSVLQNCLSQRSFLNTFDCTRSSQYFSYNYYTNVELKIQHRLHKSTTRNNLYHTSYSLKYDFKLKYKFKI